MSARGIKFAAGGAWSNIDDLSARSASVKFAQNYFWDQEMQSQSDDIVRITHAPGEGTSWEVLRERARLTGGRLATSLTALARELGWGTELGDPEFRIRSAEEEEEDRLASLVARDEVPTNCKNN